MDFLKAYGHPQASLLKSPPVGSVSSREDRDTTSAKDQTDGSRSEARFLSPAKGLGPVTTRKKAAKEGIRGNARVVLTHLCEVGVKELSSPSCPMAGEAG